MTISTNTQEFQSTNAHSIPKKGMSGNNWNYSQNNQIINHPPHYIEGRNYEPIAVIEDWKLSYHLGNALKYISRAGRKDQSSFEQDIKKAIWYLQRSLKET